MSRIHWRGVNIQFLWLSTRPLVSLTFPRVHCAATLKPRHPLHVPVTPQGSEHLLCLCQQPMSLLLVSGGGAFLPGSWRLSPGQCRRDTRGTVQHRTWWTRVCGDPMMIIFSLQPVKWDACSRDPVGTISFYSWMYYCLRKAGGGLSDNSSLLCQCISCLIGRDTTMRWSAL